MEPSVATHDAQFIGEVDDRGKAKLLGKAVALLFPIDRPEAFGLS